MNIGIDLGTTYSVAAYKNRNGEIEVVSDASGGHIVPSVVFWNDGEFVVGNAAKEAVSFAADNVRAFIKDNMGNATVLGNWGGREYRAVDLSAEIIRKIVENACSSMGEPVTGAVVTVPAYFTNEQRIETKKAVLMAGIEPIAIINEPTAAALCYVQKNKIKNERIMVYDLGGGTFDVSIIRVNEANRIEVVSTQGLKKAGGHYFDDEILKLIVAYCGEKHNINIELPEYAEDLEETRFAIEKNKRLLADYASVRIPLRFGSVKGQYELTRADFEKIVAKTYQRTEAKCKQAIKEAGLTLADIDRVLLVGGSSRIPYIENAIRLFTGKEPMKDINPEEAVAIGAAMRASMDSASDGQKVKFIDVCSHSIGISTIVNDEGDMENEIIIRKNTKVPCRCKKNFGISEDGQEKVEITVNEGEYKELTDVSQIANAVFVLPPNAAKHQKAIVTLELDESQILHVYLSVPELHYNQEYISSKIEGIRRIENDAEKVLEPVAASTSKKSTPIVSVDFVKGIPQIPDFTPIKKIERRRYFNGVAEKLGMANENCKREESLSYILDQFDDLIGLDSVKREIRTQIDRKIMERMQNQVGVRGANHNSLHMLFLGNPGTGKTSVARILGQIYYKMGALSKPNVVEVGRSDLIAGFVGQTAIKTQEVIDRAKGGILFIDEAYSLVHSKTDDYGFEAVETLLKGIEDNRNNLLVIMAGYENEMEEFLSTNPGFKSRFNRRIYFEDYSVDEMMEIFKQYVTGAGMDLKLGAEHALRELLENKSRIPDFGNARGVRNLFESVIEAKNARVLAGSKKPNKADLLFVTAEDIQIVLGRRDNEKSLEELIDELNNMVGLSAVKEQINRQITTIMVEKAALARGAQRKKVDGSKHMIFLGNPGTGKTTVARLIGGIYKQLGVLPRGEVTLEVSRSELIANVVGGTAPKVKDCVKRAMGGVLFIDEAYSLCQDERDSFGKEAVDTLLKCIEDYRDNLLVIMAGYEKEMEEFLNTNPGFKSRFNNIIYFDDYSPEDMVEILKRNLKSRGMTLEEGVDDKLASFFAEVSKDSAFGNARGVRNVLEAALANQNMRLAQKDLNNLSADEFDRLTYEDVALTRK